MNTDIWEKPISCKNLLVNVTINTGIKIFLRQQWFLPFNNSLKKYISTDQYEPDKKQSARKTFYQFSDVLDLKNCCLKVRFCQIKIQGNHSRQWVVVKHFKVPWPLEINQQVKESLYNCIIHHNKVVQYPIANDCPNIYIDITLKKN